MKERSYGRTASGLRPISFELGYQEWAEGSILLTVGKTRVLASASHESKVPRWLANTGKGWVSAEYAMLPRATSERTRREVSNGRPSGRTQEIQRLIGRSLRAAIDLDVLGEQMIWIDCDVLQADGGTRTASVTAGYVALALACRGLLDKGIIAKDPMLAPVAAVSAGIVGDQALLDLDYEEDSAAEVDFNVVMAGEELVEVQGTAEGKPYSRAQLDELLGLAEVGIGELQEVQRHALSS